MYKYIAIGVYPVCRSAIQRESTARYRLGFNVLGSMCRFTSSCMGQTAQKMQRRKEKQTAWLDSGPVLFENICFFQV